MYETDLWSRRRQRHVGPKQTRKAASELCLLILDEMSRCGWAIEQTLRNFADLNLIGFGCFKAWCDIRTTASCDHDSTAAGKLFQLSEKYSVGTAAYDHILDIRSAAEELRSLHSA